MQIRRVLQCLSRGLRSCWVGGLVGLLILAVPEAPSLARSNKVHAHHGRAVAAAGPVQASIVIDADTGDVLSQNNADARAFPASLTKLMTLYLTFRP